MIRGVGSAMGSRRMCGFGACTKCFRSSFFFATSLRSLEVQRGHYFRVQGREAQNSGGEQSDATERRLYAVAASFRADSVLDR